MDTASWYRDFAEREARGRSPLYEVLAAGVAADPQLVSWLDQLPERKRQPNLLLAAVRFVGGATQDYPTFRSYVFEHAGELEKVMLARSTQTNEVARCATLLPAFSALQGPLALIEVGTSAGLCLLADRFGYHYDGATPVGDAASACQLSCRTIGPVPIPEELPTIVWRAGIDLAPVDPFDEAAVRWLEACVWPDQPERLARLRAAMAIARRDPPRIVAGDLLEHVVPLAADAPSDATLVVFHSAVLAYLDIESRHHFAELIAGLDAVWLSNESPTVIDGLAEAGSEIHAPDRNYFVLGKDGKEVLGHTDPHGEWVAWPSA